MEPAYTICKHAGNEDSAAVLSKIEPITLNHHLWPENDYFPRVQVRSYYTDEFIQIQFRAFEENPTITYYQLNDQVCKDSCVEFFIQPTPASDPRYLNFELNAAGTLLLGIGVDSSNLEFISELDLNQFQIQPSTGLTDAESGQIYWELSFRIPVSFIRSLFPEFHAVPGTVMKGNFYKCGDETPLPHYLSWNPIALATPDFHVSSYFGEIRLGSD